MSGSGRAGCAFQVALDGSRHLRLISRLLQGLQTRAPRWGAIEKGTVYQGCKATPGNSHASRWDAESAEPGF